MDRHKVLRNPTYLFLGITGVITLAAYINIFPPDQVWHLGVFFVLLFTTIVFFCLYLFRRRRRAFVVATATLLYSILRYLGLKHPLYGILLIASIFAIEVLWRDRQ